jgi:hypothetical protein
MWVPKMLNVQHKRARKTCAELPQRCDKDRAVFLSGIITGDGTWVRHCDPLKKRNEWNGIISRLKARTVQDADFCG